MSTENTDGQALVNELKEHYRKQIPENPSYVDEMATAVAAQILEVKREAEETAKRWFRTPPKE